MILEKEFCDIDKKTGALIVDLREVYGSQSGLIRIRPWHEQVLIEHSGSSDWLQDDTVFDYPVVSEEVNELEISHPLRRFSESLPEWARDTVQPFRINQLRLLKILCVAPHAQQLARNDPLVFWLLSECMTAQSSEDEISELTRLNRRKILQRTIGYGSNRLSIL